jgi:hypothetical protein
MQLNGRRRLAAIVLTLLALAPAAGRAITVEEQDVKYLFRNFVDSDDVRVRSHYGGYEIALRGNARLSVQWNNETVTIPGVDAPAGSPEAVDAITTASRPIRNADAAFQDFVKVRNEVDGSVRVKGGTFGYYVSREPDYFAQQVRGEYARDFLQENLNISLGTSYGWDSIEPVADEDTDTAADVRTTLHWNAVATQTLTPTTLVRVGAEYSAVKGLQHNPYRNVYAGGGNVPERHPAERLRRDLFVRLNQYFRNRSSVWLTYVFYSDDWGVHAHTAGIKLNQVVTGDVAVRYRYRYHTQDAADFQRSEYATADGVDGYLTGDYRLGRLSAHLMGAKLDFGLAALGTNRGILERTFFSVGFERYFNSNNFSANVLEMGFDLKF